MGRAAALRCRTGSRSDPAAAASRAPAAAPLRSQVVAFQATMALMAESFPGAFAGYRLEVTESHQRAKVDTSGTARAIVESFRKLGIPFSEARPLGALPGGQGSVGYGKVSLALQLSEAGALGALPGGQPRRWPRSQIRRTHSKADSVAEE